MTAMAIHRMKKQIAQMGVPEVPELLEQIGASGGDLRACRMSADMMHLSGAELYEAVEVLLGIPAMRPAESIAAVKSAVSVR
jgi:peroxiredoxin family protein